MKTINRPFKFVYQLQPGEKWCLFGGLLVVVHPEREPKMVSVDGAEVILRPALVTEGHNI